jgi:hypothetical protein
MLTTLMRGGKRDGRRSTDQKVEEFAELSPSRIDVATLGFS